MCLSAPSGISESPHCAAPAARGAGFNPRPASAVLALIVLACVAWVFWRWLRPSTGCLHPGVAVDKALLDVYLDNGANDSSTVSGTIQDIRLLGARWVRITVGRGRLEPEEGVYDQQELARLDGMVDDLRAAGTIFMGVTAARRGRKIEQPRRTTQGRPIRCARPPSTTSDDSASSSPPLRRSGAAISSAGTNPTSGHASTLSAPRADPDFGARTYLRMLKALHEGVQRGDPECARGRRCHRTHRPQRPAEDEPTAVRSIPQGERGQAYFDVYAHHPYTPGGTVNHAPDGRPNDPSTTVTLYNLRTLLRLFPSKPFYLTEYGYNTEPSIYFGGFSFSEAKQAQYLGPPTPSCAATRRSRF